MSAVDEHRFKALGKEWVSRFDFNAVCEIEERTGRGFGAMVAPFLAGIDVSDIDNPSAMIGMASKIKFGDLRQILFQSLVAVQPDVTVEKAGNIIGDVGLAEIMPTVAWAISKGMGIGGDVSDAENPPQPKTRKKKQTG